MKKRHWLTLGAQALGIACALIDSMTGSDVLVTLMKPFTLLGETLRAWSLSGAAGNAGAWCLLTALSLIPVVYILLARRKRKQKSDWLFFLTGAGIFGCLFLLINPTLLVHPALTEALNASPEVLTGGPVFCLMSLLLLSVMTRWTGGLMQLRGQEERLLFWTRALLAGSMALIAFSTVFAVTEGAQAIWGGGVKTYNFQMMEVETEAAIGSDGLSAWTGGSVSDPMNALLSPWDDGAETGELIGFLLSCILLIPNLFSLRTLDAALSLAASMNGGWFTEETDARASVLAVRARHTLVAAVGCMAARNTLTVLLGQWMSDANVSFSLPLDDILISCGAMLLARLLSAACRVKRDNDLMI